jgi:hypothetical protein
VEIVQNHLFVHHAKQNRLHIARSAAGDTAAEKRTSEPARSDVAIIRCD